MISIDTFSRTCSLLSKMPSPIPWTEGQAELYGIGLRTLPDHVVTDTLARAIATCDERPSVAALVRIAGEIMNGQRPTAQSAWMEVENILITRGLYCLPDRYKPNIFREGEPRFSHPLIERSIRHMGGWRAVCTSDLTMDALRDRFRALYDELAERPVREKPDLVLMDSMDETPQILRFAAGGL